MHRSWLNNKVIICLSSVVLLLITFILGPHYEAYEAYFTALISGALTPGMLYDDMFYFAHIGLVKIYARLYNIQQGIPWLSVIQYSYMLTAFVLILHVLFKRLSDVKVKVIVSGILLFFFLEHFLLLNFTRVSFLVAMAALLALVQLKELRLTSPRFILYNLLYVVAFLTRPESAILLLAIFIAHQAIQINFKELKDSLLELVKRFAFPVLVSVLVSGSFSYQFKNSEEFYKQIEPNLEYELMVRDNIVDLDVMTNPIDSLRYQLIYLGVWGDSETNDYTFLESLVSQTERTWGKSIFSITLSRLIEVLVKLSPLVMVNTLVFILMLWFSRHSIPRVVLSLTFHLGFYLLLFAISYQVKIVERGVSPLLLALSLLYAIQIFSSQKDPNMHRGRLQWPLILLVLSFLHLILVMKPLRLAADNYANQTTKLSLFQSKHTNKKVLISSEAMDMYFLSNSPLEAIPYAKYDKLYVFNALAMSTIEPYRTYLEQSFSCNPNDYQDFFTTLLEDREPYVFLMTEELSLLLTEYMQTVHQVNIAFVKLDNTDYNDGLYAFEIVGQ